MNLFKDIEGNLLYFWIVLAQTVQITTAMVHMSTCKSNTRRTKLLT